MIPGRKAERHDGGLERRVGVFAADGEAWGVGHAVKLRTMIGRCDGWMGLLRGRCCLPTITTPSTKTRSQGI